MPKKRNAKRADGRIAVQVYLGRDENGKRKYKTVYGSTQKEADEKALAVKLAMRKGLDVTAEYDTFATWAERWLSLRDTEVAKRRVLANRCAIKHLNAAFGDVPIAKVRAADVRNMLSELAQYNPNTGRPTAKKTLSDIRSTASQIFEMAIESRVIDYNPARNIKMPKGAQSDDEGERRDLTPEEQGWIEDTPHRAKTAAMIMMHAGLRRGELIPLTWSDIDLDAHTITVNKAVEELGGKFVTKSSAKNEYSKRVIDIPMRLVEYLQSVPRTSLLVCTNVRGGMHTDSSWRRMWDSYLLDINLRHGDFSPFQRKKNGKPFTSKFDPEGVPFVIPRITPHWLRHTFATNLYLAGVDVVTAKEQLGHSKITTTLEIYTHLNKRFKRRSMDKLDAYLAGNASQMQVKET